MTIEKNNRVPFDNDYFDVVTMLALFEHIEPERLVIILSEIYRILKPGGIFIMTTPAAWTDRLLRIMAKLKLVSPTEIEEHKGAYIPSNIETILQRENFEKEKIHSGYFEIFMNI
jgi:SAM-dependent methyltransferase